MATAADVFGTLLPELKSSFWIGLVFGIVGLLYPVTIGLTITTFGDRYMAAATSGEDQTRRHGKLCAVQATVSLVLQAIATAAIGIAAFVHSPLSPSDPDDDGQKTLLIVILALFVVASLASFSAQESLNALAAPKKLDRQVWVGGVTCALIFGLLRLGLSYTRLGVRSTGLIYLITSAAISLCSVVGVRLLTSKQLAPDQRPLNVADTDAERLPTRWRLFRDEITVPGFVMGADFFLTMAFYPGLLSVLHGTSQTASRFTVILLLSFNGGDFCGKNAPSYITFMSRKENKAYLLGGLAFEYLVIAPLVVCAVLVPQLHSAGVAYTIAFFLAFVHGLVTCSAYGMVQDILKGESDAKKGLAGGLQFILSFLGVGLGAMFAVGLSYTPLVRQ